MVVAIDTFVGTNWLGLKEIRAPIWPGGTENPTVLPFRLGWGSSASQ